MLGLAFVADSALWIISTRMSARRDDRFTLELIWCMYEIRKRNNNYPHERNKSILFQFTPNNTCSTLGSTFIKKKPPNNIRHTFIFLGQCRFGYQLVSDCDRLEDRFGDDRFTRGSSHVTTWSRPVRPTVTTTADRKQTRFIGFARRPVGRGSVATHVAAEVS